MTDYSKVLQPKQPPKKDDLDPKTKAFIRALRKVHEDYKKTSTTK